MFLKCWSLKIAVQKIQNRGTYATAQSIGNLRYIFYYKIKTQMRRMKDLSMKYIEVNQQDKKVFFFQSVLIKAEVQFETFT